MQKLTHVERLLQYLQDHKTIEPLTAWRELGIYRLGARIFDLRQAGHVIERKTISVCNRFGESCHVAEYTLVGGENDI